MNMRRETTLLEENAERVRRLVPAEERAGRTPAVYYAAGYMTQHAVREEDIATVFRVVAWTLEAARG